MRKRRSQDEEEFARRAGAALLDDSELGRWVAELSRGGPAERDRAVMLSLARSVLVMAGEQGYEAVTVEALIERAGTNRARFYGFFADKAACFGWAHGAAAEALCAGLLGACEEAPDWASGVRAALGYLAGVVDAAPGPARGLFTGPGGAGALVAAERKEVFGRLSHALDRARREPTGSRHPSPPFTPGFILGAIEAAVHRFLAEPGGRAFSEELPGLLYVAVDLYLGPEAAAAQVRALGGPGRGHRDPGGSR